MFFAEQSNVFFNVSIYFSMSIDFHWCKPVLFFYLDIWDKLAPLQRYRYIACKIIFLLPQAVTLLLFWIFCLIEWRIIFSSNFKIYDTNKVIFVLFCFVWFPMHTKSTYLPFNTYFNNGFTQPQCDNPQQIFYKFHFLFQELYNTLSLHKLFYSTNKICYLIEIMVIIVWILSLLESATYIHNI